MGRAGGRDYMIISYRYTVE